MATAANSKALKKGDKVKYNARTHKGTGKVTAVRDSGRGKWVDIASDTLGAPIALRLSQVRHA